MNAQNTRRNIVRTAQRHVSAARKNAARWQLELGVPLQKPQTSASGNGRILEALQVEGCAAVLRATGRAALRFELTLPNVLP